ncbi:hypothetical protein AVEN_254081-1 [Araneus ventricosus]|uniref:Uncharacterized protein n=1 Tax=Araneus ventricosus TaxID=182803 RepID=A0A4Y2BZT5_ARAVE|nr:hypothetical protein AVEN_254081-1 [Araneus ventricosus]
MLIFFRSEIESLTFLPSGSPEITQFSGNHVSMKTLELRLVNSAKAASLIIPQTLPRMTDYRCRDRLPYGHLKNHQDTHTEFHEGSQKLKKLPSLMWLQFISSLQKLWSNVTPNLVLKNLKNSVNKHFISS